MGRFPGEKLGGHLLQTNLIHWAHPCRYIDEALPGKPLLPRGDPYARAKARTIIDRFCGKAVPEFYKMLLRQASGGQGRLGGRAHASPWMSRAAVPWHTT